MNHLSLFSGIGGLDLAAEWAGFETVGQCEMADYPTKILEKHWPDVSRWRDIRTLTKEDFYARTGLRTVDIISGGFPCQPFSVAGKQKGREDDRYLWPEMRRVIAELEPRWVVGENVPGILRIAAKDVIEDLESMGYHVLLLDFEAAAVGAFHRRERIAFVANRDDHGQPAAKERGSFDAGGGGRTQRQEQAGEFEGLCAAREHEAVADANCRGLRNDGNNGRETNRKEHEAANSGDAGGTETLLAYSMRSLCKGKHRWEKSPRFEDGYRWPAEPNVGRVAHGVPHRVDRIKGLGNAVCPPQFYPIFRAIYEWENGTAISF